MRPVLVLISAYLLGSVPFGYLIVRAKEGADVRATGSGGTGATNVSRLAGKLAGVVTLLLDAAKGALAVLIARFFATEDFGANWWVAASAILAVVGHCFPVWLGFRGGKGVATTLGVLLAVAPLVGLVACLAWLGTAVLFRYSSLAALAAIGTRPLVALALGREGEA
nr:glycerol-3-phosphate acyltransferase [Acidobacteriota bacterium]